MSGLDVEHLRHRHVFLAKSHDANARRTLRVVALTVVTMLAEIVAGYVTGSMALLADGLHMATHAGALGISAAAYAFARRHASNLDFSFGTGKVGDLAGFASAMILGIVALGIGVESMLRLFQPAQVAFAEATWVAAIGLLVNIASAALLSSGDGQHLRSHHNHNDHHHHHTASHTRRRSAAGDNSLRSAYVHVLADAFTSILAIAALLAGRYLGWIWLDSAMGIIGALVIGRWSWSLMRDTAAILLDRSDQHVAEEMRELVESPGDARIFDLHVWRIGPEAHAGIVSVCANEEVDEAAIRQRLSTVREMSHLTVEVRRP